MANNKPLNFGKFKGKTFEQCPEWYQKWLQKQDWFNRPAQEQPLHKQLNGWDGHSTRGQAVYDAIFEREKEEQEQHDPSDRYGMYND